MAIAYPSFEEARHHGEPIPPALVPHVLAALPPEWHGSLQCPAPRLVPAPPTPLAIHVTILPVPPGSKPHAQWAAERIVYPYGDLYEWQSPTGATLQPHGAPVPAPLGSVHLQFALVSQRGRILGGLVADWRGTGLNTMAWVSAADPALVRYQTCMVDYFRATEEAARVSGTLTLTEWLACREALTRTYALREQAAWETFLVGRAAYIRGDPRLELDEPLPWRPSTLHFTFS